MGGSATNSSMILFKCEIWDRLWKRVGLGEKGIHLQVSKFLSTDKCMKPCVLGESRGSYQGQRVEVEVEGDAIQMSSAKFETRLERRDGGRRTEYGGVYVSSMFEAR